MQEQVTGSRVPLTTAPAPLFSRGERLLAACACVLLLLLSVGCRRDMQDQPKMKPFRGTSFFGDGLSGRQSVEGTIARGFLRTDTEFYTGKKSRPVGAPATASPTQAPAPSAGANASATTNAFPDDVDTFPFPVTADTVIRGKERYEIFCSVCHGLTGNGDGIVVRRGFRRAASFNDDRLRQAPVGHFFDAITNGWGAMPPYAQQIVVQDRWAIIAYVRALQLSQQRMETDTAAILPKAPSSPAAAASPQQAPRPTSSTGGHQ